MTPIEAILSFLIGLAANGITSEILLARQKSLDEALQDADALRKALKSQVPLSDEVGLACIELAEIGTGWGFLAKKHHSGRCSLMTFFKGRWLSG